MRRVLAVIVVALLSASCSSTNNVNVVPKEELELRDDIYGREDRPPSNLRNVTVTVYFVGAARAVEDVRLVPIERTDETARPTAEFAMEQLFKGPTAEEIDIGLLTAIPPRTRLVGLTVEDEVAKLNFAGEFEAPAEELRHQLRIAQIVYTLTYLPEVKSVTFLIHGVQQLVIDQDGVPHEEVARPRYSNFAPKGEGAGLEP